MLMFFLEASFFSFFIVTSSPNCFLKSLYSFKYLKKAFSLYSQQEWYSAAYYFIS